MSLPGGTELIIILFIVLLLFGARKLPDLAGSMGRSIREFRKASHEALDDEQGDGDTDTDTSTNRHDD
ncbi:MAG: twin-arginine translocase TatA/TatE family subunit [Nitriliruptoraceae bacterium]